jgi:hypothetical protein
LHTLVKLFDEVSIAAMRYVCSSAWCTHFQKTFVLACALCYLYPVGCSFAVLYRVFFGILSDMSVVFMQDLPGALDDAAITESLELHKIKSRQWAIFKTSAIKGEGLFEGLDW